MTPTRGRLPDGVARAIGKTTRPKLAHRAYGRVYWQSLVFRSWLADKIAPKGWYAP